MYLNCSVYLVTDRAILGGRSLFDAVRRAIQGGVTLVQLREKNISSREFFELAVNLKKVVNSFNVPLIINDRLDIALAADADGLHIGQEDLPIESARRLLNGKILGYSVENVKQSVYGEQNGADYLGAGTVFATSSKEDACEPIGLDTLKEIKQAVSIPVVGIGGINESNIGAVKKTGIDGISVISAILGKKDIKNAAEKLSQAWNS
jgi:thiamine-phosphate pyrophosphorylase